MVSIKEIDEITLYNKISALNISNEHNIHSELSNEFYDDLLKEICTFLYDIDSDIIHKSNLNDKVKNCLLDLQLEFEFIKQVK